MELRLWKSVSQLHTEKTLVHSTSRPVKDWMKQLEASRAPILIISSFAHLTLSGSLQQLLPAPNSQSASRIFTINHTVLLPVGFTTPGPSGINSQNPDRGIQIQPPEIFIAQKASDS